MPLKGPEHAVRASWMGNDGLEAYIHILPCRLPSLFYICSPFLKGTEYGRFH